MVGVWLRPRRLIELVWILMLKSNNLQPYPTYKPSNIKWLGKVPTHWELHKLRGLLTGATKPQSVRSTPAFGCA